MKVTNTSERLKEYMSKYKLKQVDILAKSEPFCKMYDIKINKSDLSQYVSGKTEPGQDKLFVLARALNVSEIWLMGYDDIKEENKEKELRSVDRIQQTINFLGISSSELMKRLGFPKDLFSLWKENKSKPSLHDLQIIANYLDEDVFYFQQDELRKKAIIKFGFCYEPLEAEKIKNHSRELIATHSLSPEQELKENINVFKALFSRSLFSCRYNLEHVNFDTYIAMLLNQDCWKSNCGIDIYNKLLDKYGKKEGIPSGTKYKPICIEKIDDLREYSIKLNKHEKKVILSYRKMKDMQLAIDRLLKIE